MQNLDNIAVMRDRISIKTLKTLEFDKILKLVTQYSVSEVCFDNLLKIEPSTDINEAKANLALTKEAYLIYHKYNAKVLQSYDDITDILEKSKVLSILQLHQLKSVAKTIAAAVYLKNTVLKMLDDIVLFKGMLASINPDTSLQFDIDKIIIGDNEISDDASPALKDIRKKLNQASSKLKDKLANYSKNNEISKYLQDNIVTIRDGRYVLPVKSEYRHQVQGLIHDRSGTGSTLFIEPFIVVEMNNEIKSLKIDELIEIERILKELSLRVKNTAESTLECQKILIMCDVVLSKMHFCVSFNCNEPKINTVGFVNLIESRHPLIAKDKIVPVSISVGSDYKILAITGPNTGGKTVALKTVGLFCIMAAAGFFIPANEGSEVSIFSNIFADIGDEQSIANSLSTFSSHMSNIAKITNSVTHNSLVLFDELGSGTDPIEGAALALGILKFLEKIGCTGLITTHYPQIKEYALRSKNLMNACMQFDEQKLLPTYKLLLGLPGASNALKIASKLGLKKDILDMAYEVLPKQNIEFEKVLNEAEAAKRDALNEFEKFKIEKIRLEKIRLELSLEKEKLNKKLESLNINARAETARLVENRIDEADELMESLKERIRAAEEKDLEIVLFEIRKTKNKLEEIKYQNLNSEQNSNQLHQPINAAKLKKGDEVFIKSLEVVGRVLEIFSAKKEAKVQAGAAAMIVKFKNLASPIKQEQKKSAYKIKQDIEGNSSLYTREIRLLGLTVAEAMMIIEQEIEGSIFNGETKLRLVHGKGTGALKNGIWAQLKGDKRIKKFGYAAYGEGDSGVTVLEFK
ncbi:MAG: endonuclease MutS2 [Firmicutes bacterium]|nr:endonuclease MutS2 [Bacillota bacterium]